MTALEEAREFFAKDVYATGTTGAVIEEVGERYAKCSLAIDARHKNAYGYVMGGAVFTLADLTFAVATNFRQSATVSATSHINFLSVAKGDVLYAESKLLKDGRRTCFYEIHVTDNLGTPVAVVTITGAHVGA